MQFNNRNLFCRINKSSIRLKLVAFVALVALPHEQQKTYLQRD